MVGTSDPPLPYTTEPFLAQWPLKNPLFVATEPGTRNLLVILQGGEKERPSRIVRVHLTSGTSPPGTLLEVPGHLVYSLAFHSGYATNGHLFVFANGITGETERTNRLSRFTVDRSDPWAVIPGSETILLEWRSAGHDGGGLGFGPDGMLYVSTGDGSSDSDAWNSGQTLDDLLGAVLRIDVDHPDAGRSYSIPSSNPFVNLAGARGEIWAYGLRNPWRLTVDSETGQVWVGNNGQDLWETAHLIRPGENYGWSVYEGSHLFYRNRRRGPTPVVPPTFEHHHSEARSLTGGVVYRGKRRPDLDGAYVYGDHSTGRIWGGRYDGNQVVWHRELAATPLQITGFGISPHDDLLIADLGTGLHRLVPAPRKTNDSSFPRLLSESGIFSTTREHLVQPGVIPYSVNAPGWVDGASVERFLALPGDSRITYVSSRGWGFADGAVLAQTLWFPGTNASLIQGRRVETRLLTRQEGRWAGYSYRWNPEQTDAVLVDAAGTEEEITRPDPASPGGFRTQRWRFPSRSECLACHSRAVGFVLGMSELQLNRDHTFPGGIRDNQLRALDHIGFFTESLPKPAAELGRLVDPSQSGIDLELRARSYLHVNCSVCHVEAGGGNSRMQLEFTTARDRMELIGARPQHDTFGIRDAMLVAPGHPDRSVLLQRVSRRGGGQMPPLVSEKVDEAAVALFREWIASLPSARVIQREWTTADFQTELGSETHGRSFESGKAAFRDTGCIQCHRIAGDGGNVGPDLTTLGQRSPGPEILEAVLIPSKIIAPEYALTEIQSAAGETLVGRVESETDSLLVLRPTGAEQTVGLSKADVRSRRLSPVSNMPEGMLNTLEKSQVLDLIAYLLAGGDEYHPLFGR